MTENGPGYWLTRGSMDFDGYREGDRIGDEIYECSRCHTLYRARWRLVSFTQLVEKVSDIEGRRDTDQETSDNSD